VPAKPSNDPVRSPEKRAALPALKVDEAAIEKASRLFRALGDSSRLRLSARLAQREMCVTQIASAENEALSTISQRLRVLRLENIVVRKRRGKVVNYALADSHVTELIENALAHSSEE
jgi:DNA-binding transcriptional ArsR family regulator